jgi:hypothetical protein
MADIHYIRGTGHWMKILGPPVKNYAGDGFEWTMDITPDEEGIRKLRELGLAERLKNKGDDRGDFIPFRQREKRMDGTLNRPISVVDADGNPWPENQLIGNKSTVDVKFEVKDYGRGKKAGVYPQAVRVLNLVPYQRVEFAPLNEDDEFFRAKLEDDGAPPEPVRDELDDDDPIE